MQAVEVRSQQFDIRRTQLFKPTNEVSPEMRVPYVENEPIENKEEKIPGSTVEQHIRYFDRNWKTEGLQADWFRLQSKEGKQVGFSVNSQMDMLHDPLDQERIALWTQQTKRDLLGFKLEYLTDHLVYPCKYERSSTDPTRFENRLYGNTDMIDTVSGQERNGSVRNGLQDMKAFFLDNDTPDHSIAVMVSPKGKTGLTTDNGKAIRYPDSYFFIMQKDGDSVNNFTLKTDFSLHECREAITRLTGITLPVTASVEDYVQTIAKIKPGDHGAIPQVNDIVGVLEQIRPEYAFKPEGKNEKTKWNTVYSDIIQGEQLYAFNQKTQHIIDEFEAYCLNGIHTREDYQRAIAATILRLSKVFFVEEQQPTYEVSLQPNKWSVLKPPTIHTFGTALRAAAERPGCAGGGESFSFGSTLVNSITPLLGTKEEWFSCPECYYRANGPVGNACPGCGLTKEAYAEKSGQIMCD